MTRDELIALGESIRDDYGIAPERIVPVTKKLRGLAVWDGTLHSPWPTSTVKRLSVFAHEVGHFHLGHMDAIRRGFKPSWRVEYEAEYFAQQLLLRRGVKGTKEAFTRGREYVGRVLQRCCYEGADMELVQQEVRDFIRPVGYKIHRALMRSGGCFVAKHFDGPEL